MNELAKFGKGDVCAATNDVVRIGVLSFQKLTKVEQGVENGGLASAVATKEKSEGPDRNFDLITDPLEVFDDDFGDGHRFDSISNLRKNQELLRFLLIFWV